MTAICASHWKNLGTPMAELSAMTRDIAEIPEAAARLIGRGDAIADLAARIAKYGPRFVILCGRGSSGHAGVYLRYVIETKLRLMTSAAAPSVTTIYGAHPNMAGALFVTISQSGQSPDLVVTTEVARERGALTLAIVNDSASPLAEISELVLPIQAGVERAVAATKTVVLSMLAGTQLVARIARDNALAKALDALPERLAAALTCDWSAWESAVATASAAFAAGRGYALGPAREIALKLMESLRIPALGFSTAELRHGPRAAITRSTPVLILRQNDGTAASADVLANDLRADGVPVFMAGGRQGDLPWIGDRDPVCDPIAMLLPAYKALEGATRMRGFDPDHPPHLNKITQTL